MRTRTFIIAMAAAGLTGLSIPAAEAQATEDPLWADQYGPQMIGAPAAWTKATGKGITVAVVDSGIDVDHPDLKGKIDFANSYDFACNDTNPDDDAKTVRNGPVKGHGTHVAGTIGAATGNKIGVAGVAPNARLMGLKVWGSEGDPSGCTKNVNNTAGDLQAIVNAINWAVDKGAKVINLSLSEFGLGDGLIGSTQTPCRNAFARGALCVVAAGNSGDTDSSGYSRDFTGVVVTANDAANRHADFGQKADTMWGVSAPGVAILNTWPIDDPARNGYNSIQGTSMAAPHVAGAAAVLFSMGLTNREVAEKLVKTAGPPNDPGVEGAGLIHLDRAVGVVSAGTAATAPSGAGGAGTVSKGAAKNAAGGTGTGGSTGGGSKSGVTTPAGADTFLPEEGTDFEEGLGDNGSKDSIENQLLSQPRNTSASKPFNAVLPIAVISLVALLAGGVLAIPRLRSTDKVEF